MVSMRIARYSLALLARVLLTDCFGLTVCGVVPANQKLLAMDLWARCAWHAEADLRSS